MVFMIFVKLFMSYLSTQRLQHTYCGKCAWKSSTVQDPVTEVTHLGLNQPPSFSSAPQSQDLDLQLFTGV